MPELPEVEVICRGLIPQLSGRKIINFSYSSKKLRLPVPIKRLHEYIKGATIKDVERRAKYLLLHMENGAILVIHLGMTGRMNMFPEKTPRAKHDHLCWQLDNGKELRFNDARRFGSIQVLLDQGEEEAFFSACGPEPFSRGFSAVYLLSKATKKKQPIKNFLMDSRVVVGIGNIYVNEILFAAKISPTTPVKIITRDQWQEIITVSRKILKQAIKSGGTTISDYINSNGEPGWFQLKLKVYGRDKEKCLTCKNLIQKTVMAGRATFYCPKCQN